VVVDISETEGEGLVGPSSLVVSFSSRAAGEPAASCDSRFTGGE
jgi:hypothetical protein